MNNDYKYFIYCTNINPQFPSCEGQEEWMIQLAESQEINVAGVFKDNHPSTTQLDLLLEAMKKNEAQGILVWDISLIPSSLEVRRLIRANKLHAIKPFLDK